MQTKRITIINRPAIARIIRVQRAEADRLDRVSAGIDADFARYDDVFEGARGIASAIHAEE